MLRNEDEEDTDATEDEERTERDGEDTTADVGVPKMEDVNTESKLGTVLTMAGDDEQRTQRALEGHLELRARLLRRRRERKERGTLAEDEYIYYALHFKFFLFE